MADNVHGGSNDAGLPNIATDDVAGVQYQRVKLDVGENGASSPVVGSLPVSDAGGSLTVDGSLTVVQASAANLNVTVTGAAVQGAQMIANPIPIAGRAWDSTPSDVDDGDAQWLWTKRNGALVITADGALPVGVAQTATVRAELLPFSSVTEVDSSATSVTISSGNYAGPTLIFNDSTSPLRLNLNSSAATSSNYSVKVAAGADYGVPYSYSGAITGFWDSAEGHARVTWFSLQGWD